MEPTKQFGTITSEAELDNLQVKLADLHPNELILFRGQTRLFPTVRSGRARPNSNWQPMTEEGWDAVVDEILRPLNAKPATHRMRQAILQHYGLATHFLDLTASPQVACWFATHEYEESRHLYIGHALRMPTTVSYSRTESGEGYLIVLVIGKSDSRQQNATLFDLSDLPGFIRPHRQHGWLIYDRPPIQPDPNAFCRYIIPVDRTCFRSSYRQKTLFPAPKDDKGYASLLAQPFVQIPSAVIEDLAPKDADVDPDLNAQDSERNVDQRSKAESSSRLIDHMCFAKRVVDPPEYNSAEYDHKWRDTTIYEPHPMRIWYRWDVELSNWVDGVPGNLGRTTKITIAPSAMQVLVAEVGQHPLSWPELDTDGLFFTLAAFDHDKVIDHHPPYEGVWLQRQHDMIVETPVSADEKLLHPHAGHAYLMWDDDLKRQDIPIHCPCDEPEIHDLRVSLMLTMPALIRSGLLKFVDHPFRLPDWYIAW